MNTQATHAVIGLGRTGLSIIRFLQKRGISCIAFDENKNSNHADLECPCHIGPLKAESLLAFEHIVLSPGIPWQHPIIQQAKANGCQVYGDLALFAQHYQGELYCITGTNGKTTAVSLSGTLMETCPQGVRIAGNIGTPMLDLLDEDEVSPRIMLELSSFQLERSPNVHPRWAALINIQPDHADMHASPSHYREAKLRLFAQQTKGDTAVLPADIAWETLANDLQARGVIVQRHGIVQQQEAADAGVSLNDKCLFWKHNGQTEQIEHQELRLRGLHQHGNAALAALAATHAGVSAKVIRQAICSFPGLSHRLQAVGHYADKDWFNDSKATNPAAANMALQSFDTCLWICGGDTKGLQLHELQSVLAQGHVKHAFIIGHQVNAFERLLKKTATPYTIAYLLEQAVMLAAQHQSHCPVLLSPAAASLDQFSSYAERGLHFIQHIKELQKKP